MRGKKVDVESDGEEDWAEHERGQLCERRVGMNKSGMWMRKII